MRRLAAPLLKITVRKIDEGVAREEDLLDVIEAMKMVAECLNRRRRFLEGHQMFARAVS